MSIGKRRAWMVCLGILYLGLWLVTSLFGRQAVSEHVYRVTPGLAQASRLVTFDPQTYRIHTAGQSAWVHVGNASAICPFVVSVDVASGGPGYAQAMRLTFLWFPGMVEPLRQSDLWQEEWNLQR